MASERVTHWILINFSTTAPTKSAHSILPRDLGKAPKTTRKVHISQMSLGVPGGGGDWFTIKSTVVGPAMGASTGPKCGLIWLCSWGFTPVVIYFFCIEVVWKTPVMSS